MYYVAIILFLLLPNVVYGQASIICSPQPCDVLIDDPVILDNQLTDIETRLTALEGGIGDYPNIQIAHTNTTIGDAGIKIQAAINQLILENPEGGIVDARGFKHPSNMTGFTIPPGVTVQLNHGLFTLECGSPIIINQGGRLIGEGTSSPGATKIKLGNGCNHDVIHAVAVNGTTDWWHHGEIAWIRVDCNRANNTTCTGIRVFNPGEVSQIHNVLIQQCPEDALWIKGSWAGTQSVDNVTMNLNDGWAIHLLEFRSTAQFNNVGGDDNAGLLWVDAPRTGGGNIQVNNFKYEGPGNPVFLISGGSATIQLSIVNGGIVTAPANPPVGDIVRIENAFCLTGTCNAHRVTIENVFGGQYHATVVNDADKGVQVVSPSSSFGPELDGQYITWVHYSDGAWTRLHNGKFEESLP